jgi:hypothetical protein
MISPSGCFLRPAPGDAGAIAAFALGDGAAPGALRRDDMPVGSRAFGRIGNAV